MSKCKLSHPKHVASGGHTPTSLVELRLSDERASKHRRTRSNQFHLSMWQDVSDVLRNYQNSISLSETPPALPRPASGRVFVQDTYQSWSHPLTPLFDTRRASSSCSSTHPGYGSLTSGPVPTTEKDDPGSSEEVVHCSLCSCCDCCAQGLFKTVAVVCCLSVTKKKENIHNT